MEFKYYYIDTNKEYKEGTVRASSQEEAKISLVSKGIVPIELKRKLSFEIGGSKLPKRKVLALCSMLSNCLDGGLTITVALSLVEEQAPKNEKKIYNDIIRSINVGDSIPDAFRKTGKFDEEFIAVLEVGALNQDLPAALANIESSYEQSIEITSSIKHATTYPVVLIIMGIILLIFFLEFIMPRLEELFADMTLPAYTAAYLKILNSIRDNWYIISLVIVGLFVAYTLTPKTDYINEIIYKVKYRYLPTKNLLQAMFEVKLVQMLLIFTQTGVPLNIAFIIMQSIFKDRHTKTMFNDISTSISKGNSLTTSLENADILGKMTLAQISTAEESGSLDKALESINKSATKNLKNRIKSMTTMIEPIFTITIGLVIGSLVVALMLPILTMSQNINIE
ncbi:type II secretion system F family protein [Clostridium tertium]|uniref:type II secretion system F family protein n=1 Tax=Clostridium tertium TaxID=1559 RepID=UPI0023B2EFC8|nr:type II secretion system F family protein [Clostridium tertium]